MDGRARSSVQVSVAAHAAAVLFAMLYARSHSDAPPRTLQPPIDLELFEPQPAASASIQASVERTRPALPHEDPRETSSEHRVPTGPRIAVTPPAAVEPTPPAPTTEPSVPPPEEPAFLSWNRTNAPAPSSQQGSSDVFASASHDAERAAFGGALHDSPSGQADDADGTQARAVEASSGFVRRTVDDAFPSNVAGSLPYYGHVRTAAARAWQPPAVTAPTMLQGVVSTFFAPVSTYIDATQRSLGPLASGRGAAMADSLDAAHPNSPMLRPGNTMRARADATARTTSVEIEVDQDAQGHIVATNILRRSGYAGFDCTAVDAIRQAVLQQDPHPMPGGWRSRWEFSVTVSRDPLLSALPSLPGEGALGLTAEVDFDEVTGETEVHTPLRVHRRRLVRLISSHVITPAPSARANGPTHAS